MLSLAGVRHEQKKLMPDSATRHKYLTTMKLTLSVFFRNGYTVGMCIRFLNMLNFRKDHDKR